MYRSPSARQPAFIVENVAMGSRIVAAVGGAPINASAADYGLKYGHPGPVGPDSDDHVAGEFLKFFLEARSNGRMEVQIFPGSQLGSFREMVEQVNGNALEEARILADRGLLGEAARLCRQKGGFGGEEAYDLIKAARNIK